MVAGLVLAGGRSERMGTPKASLEWHGSTLLRRVTGLLARALDGPVVVARAPGRRLPPLSQGIEVVEDEWEGGGPVSGLVAGIHALEGRAEWVYAASCDAPLLHPAFVRAVCAGREDEAVDAVVPDVGGQIQPLGACYRVAAVGAIQGGDLISLRALLGCLPVRWLSEADLLADPVVTAHDPQLESLRDLDSPADYRTARALPAPVVRVGEIDVAATTLGAAAEGSGLPLEDCVRALVGGEEVALDPELPLARGDVIRLVPRGPSGVPS